MIKTEKLRALMERVEARRGRFTLFGVFLREDSPGLWDLVIAAPWLQSDDPKALREFAKELAKTFTPEEVMSFSRIVTLKDAYPSLQTILSETASARKPLEKQGRDLFGLPVEHVVILRAESPKSRLNGRKRAAAACR